MNTHRQLRVAGALVVLVLLSSVLAVSCGDRSAEAHRYHCPMHPTYIADRPGDCPICGMRLVPLEDGDRGPGTGDRSPTHPQEGDRGPGTGDRSPTHPQEGDRGPGTGDRSPTHPDDRETKEGHVHTEGYVCFMCPSVHAEEPGRCPTCGMPLQLAAETEHLHGDHSHEADPSAPAHRTIVFYRNPMDPTVTSPVPKKDEMGMDYVPVFEDEVEHGDSGGVPGMAAVTLTDEGLDLAGVQTARAELASIGRAVRTVGTVTADETRVRHVHTKISGWVEKLFVNFVGQLVRAGEPILTIYSQELLASQEEFLRAREAASRFSSSELPEVRKGGEELLAAARRRLELFDVPESLIAELERTGQPQRTVTLPAPVSGYVTAKATFEGHQVEPGMELFTITDLSRVWIEADFYESEARFLALGQPANLTLPYDPTVRLAGHIGYVYPTLDAVSRTLRVRFEFPNRDLALKPGMFANVELQLGRGEAVVVPDSAVMDTGERQVVFVSLGGGRFVPRQVTTGVRSHGRIEVLTGLEPGDEVVIRANFLLDSESRLRAAIAGDAAGHQH